MSDFETRWRALVSGEARDWWAPAARGGLAALSGLYAGVVTGYRAGFDLGLLRTQELPCPVIAVGNLTVGGTGKTTTVRWLTRRLVEWGVRPTVLSYGYRAGGTKDSPKAVVTVAGPEGIREPVQVSGDEPQMLARSLPGVPVVIGRKRVLSGRRAWEEFRMGACVLDDAFQYWRLRKDLEIVLLNATNPFGYGYLVPRGMLREPVSALRRAQAVLITHADRAGAAERQELKRQVLRRNAATTIAEARHVPARLRDHATGETAPFDELRRGRWLALSSLGQPESFERTLEDLGAADAALARYPDHHPYSERDLRREVERVRSSGLAGIVTTEKDAVKVPPEWLDGTRVLVLEIDLEFISGQDLFEQLLRRVACR